MKLKKMRTIAWDVDDVLNDLMKDWLDRKWRPAHPTSLAYKELTENPPHLLLNVTLETYLASLDDFRVNEGYQGMSPIPEILEWFQQHGDQFRHIALTAVPLNSAPASAAWVIRHFGKWIRTYHFVPSHRTGQCLPEFDRRKSDFLSWIAKVNLLVDDNLDNIAAARSLGCDAVVMPRPWNAHTVSINATMRAITLAAYANS